MEQLSFSHDQQWRNEAWGRKAEIEENRHEHDTTRCIIGFLCATAGAQPGFERQVVREENIVDTIGACLGGMKFGPGRQFGFGDGWQCLLKERSLLTRYYLPGM